MSAPSNFSQFSCLYRHTGVPFSSFGSAEQEPALKAELEVLQRQMEALQLMTGTLSSQITEAAARLNAIRQT